MDAHTYGRCFHFRGKKYSKMILKLNLSVKTSLHGLSQYRSWTLRMLGCWTLLINTTPFFLAPTKRYNKFYDFMDNMFRRRHYGIFSCRFWYSLNGPKMDPCGNSATLGPLLKGGWDQLIPFLCRVCYRMFQNFFQPEHLLFSNSVFFIRFSLHARPGSIEVSWKLPTYPSLKPTLILTSHLGQNVRL